MTSYLSVFISLIIFQWLSQYRAIFWCNLDYMTRHIQVITCIIMKGNLRSCFFMKRKNSSTFWLACVKPRYKDFNINRCWPTCQSAWCIDCCPLQLKKKMKFWNPNSTLQFKPYKLTFKRSKTCQPACRNLDRRGWCMGWKCVGGIFLDFATVLSKCKELAFVHKKN